MLRLSFEHREHACQPHLTLKSMVEDYPLSDEARQNYFQAAKEYKFGHIEAHKDV